jgi:chorismate synthase
MAGNTFGSSLKLTTFGESHGVCIGGILDGIPPNMLFDLQSVQAALDKRRPGTSRFVTPRDEIDQIEILSGVFEGKTLGTPLAFRIMNKNQQSSDYDDLKQILRPGHGDYTYQMKYGHRDHRGGGRASARETAARVAGGAIALQILNHILQTQIVIRACTVQLGSFKVMTPSNHYNWDLVNQNPFHSPCAEVLPEWQSLFDSVMFEGRSIGAVLYVEALGVPVGLGEPVFDKLDADLAKALMSINAVKAVALGDTFDVAAADTGYDEMNIDNSKIAFDSNKAGGTLAGISSGQTISALAAFKPTSSSKLPRKAATLDGAIHSINVQGRHDPCVALRAAPIVEAMTALTLADHLIRYRGQCSLHNQENFIALTSEKSDAIMSS